MREKNKYKLEVLTVKKYVSWGNYIEVELTDGRIFEEALLYPNEFANNEHVLEFKNENKLSVQTEKIKRLYCKENNKESILI